MNLFDATYDYAAGLGMVWVRAMCVTTLYDDAGWWTETRIEYVAVDAGSQRARDEAGYLAAMHEGLRAAYYADFVRWLSVQQLAAKIETRARV